MNLKDTNLEIYLKDPKKIEVYQKIVVAKNIFNTKNLFILGLI